MTSHELLRGVVDLHIHAGPSIARREVDAGDMLNEATNCGYRAIVVKDHYFPTMMSATLVEKHLGKTGVRVFGGIALNNSVGGINVKAVDAACGMGAKFVWMPTVSTRNHVEMHKGHFPGSGPMSVPEQLITYVDDKGQLDPKVIEVLSYLAKRNDVILGTGHGSLREIDALVNKAVELKVSKILVNHPFFLVGAAYTDMARWAKLGAFIELNAGVFAAASRIGDLPIDVAVKVLEHVPVERIVIDSDLGQKGSWSPVDGLARFFQALMKDAHVTEEQIDMMAKDTPTRLAGLL